MLNYLITKVSFDDRETVRRGTRNYEILGVLLI